MRNKIISLLLCAVLLLSAAVPVYADEVEETAVQTPDLTIADAKEFLAFAEKCRLDSYSRELYVELQADIDLSGTDFAGIPIFGGTFDGNGHSIIGLDLTAEGSHQGLFRYLTDTALVQDLRVCGKLTPGGSRNQVGAIAGHNAGTITGCAVSAEVAGSGYVGGIAGSNAVMGMIENCTVDGQIYGDHFVGGITGQNLGVVRDCVNRAPVNTTPQQNSVKIADITMDTLTNSEAVSTATDIGGIAGNSTGVIRGCVNHADVGYKHMGYNIGGIAGTQSGYISACENYGAVCGRKEVGGIVGQMEPAAVIEYTEDTLQILKGQLGTMTGLVNRASSNAMSNAAGISSQLGVLQYQTETARDAVGTLIPDPNNPQLPDQDTVLAAQNTLSSTLSAMPNTVKSIAYAAQSTVSGLSRDLQAVSGQISAMGSTLNQADENIGGTVTDVSDEDTDEELTGKVEQSVNYGRVLGDLNIGGIAGAMAVENDMDIFEDWEQYGEESLNFDSKIRAVILSCENRGVITAQKQNAGGIAGWQSVGLVKRSINTGKLDSAKAQFVGGISGMSTGFIRYCSAKCEIYGASVAGGIAGSASIATDSLAMVRFAGVNERSGAILGQREEPLAEEEDPVARNFYARVDTDPGAIDGISYDGIAQPLSQSDFLVQEGLARIFKSVCVSFLYEDGTRQEITLVPGGRLNPDRIPQVPHKEGYSGVWAGLEEAQLNNILFDLQFEAVYTAYRTVLQTEPDPETGYPQLLLEGSFTDGAEMWLEEADAPVLAEGEALLGSWHFTATEAGHTAHLRYDAEVTEEVKLLVDGQPVDFRTDGSYLVFPMTGTEAALTLLHTEPAFDWRLPAAGGAVLLAAAVVIVMKKRKKKPAPTETE